jgi:ABC-type multidrug transport system ATPase subunit
MKIILTEIRGDKEIDSHEFNQPVIKLGRDSERNDLVFERELWPTVSRVHAEIRLENGHWYLTDQGSRAGTLLNGTTVSTATEIHSGSLIQFGLAGPQLKVRLLDEPAATPSPPDFSQTFVDYEAASQQAALLAHGQHTVLDESPVPDAHVHETAQKVERQQPALSPTAQPLPSLPAKPTKSVPFLICESGSPVQVGVRFEIKDDRTLLGRDPTATITIIASAPVVSRHHAEIQRQSDGTFVIVDLKSFNGTLVNGQRIAQPTALHDGDLVQFAGGGPIFRFSHPVSLPADAEAYKTRQIVAPQIAEVPVAVADDIHISLDTIESRVLIDRPAPYVADNVQFLFQRRFDARGNLLAGREPDNDIQLDGLMISKRHAKFINTPQGVFVEDLGSTNGVYVNGERIRGRRLIQNVDLVQVGAFVLRADALSGVAVFDTRSKTRIDAIAITETLARNSGRGSRNLLDEVSLAIEPNEFIGLLGPSGAGKTLLLTALNGIRHTTGGRVFINNLDLYQHLDSLKQWLGYVPQDDIIHRELTVYRTLYYVARLRLSRDVPSDEIENIISEVLDVTGLTDRRDVLVGQLSGGQRKRVSIAVELITKPSVIFLDEPTSGLDPATEQRIMKLFRQITESGRTVILTTHAMENVRLFDRIVLLMRGKLVFYGTPSEALEFVGARSFIDLYNKLEEPVEAELENLAPLPSHATKSQQRAHERRCEEIADTVAEDWRRRFTSTALYHRYIAQPLSLVNQEAESTSIRSRRRGVVDAILQWVTLVRRYTAVMARDKLNLLILLGQAPIIAVLIYVVVGKNEPRDFAYFILALVSVWFGTSVAARELVKERPIFERERMVNLGLLPYVASKLFVLSFIVGFQTTLLFVTVKLFAFFGLISLPGLLFGLPQLLTMALTGFVGIALGLFISALVKTSEVATSLVPLVLIPQILFAGLVAVPTGVSKVVGAVMPATWSYDELKRLSSLDTLQPEGSDVEGPNKGRGLYKHIEDLNKENFTRANNQLNEYKQSVTEALKAQERRAQQTRNSSKRPAVVNEGTSTPTAPSPPPPIPTPQELSEDLSNYVSFKHPWGSLVLDAAVLIAMFFTLLFATLIALRVRDIR